MVKGVLFDMDGTMLDSEPVSESCWMKAAEELGYKIEKDLMNSFFGKNLVSIEKMLADAIGIGEKAADIVAGRQKYYSAYIRENEMPKKKGLVELLEYLKEKKIPAVVCTSTETELGEIALKNAGVYDYFSGYVFGDMVTRTKPDPQGFQMAARAIGLSSEDCLVIEDSPNGILAGKAAGGYTIFVPDRLTLTEEVRDGITAEMNSLDEIIEWIEQENKKCICMKQK